MKIGGCLVKIKKIKILLLNQILHYPQIKYDEESQNMAKQMKKINYAHKVHLTQKSYQIFLVVSPMSPSKIISF